MESSFVRVMGGQWWLKDSLYQSSDVISFASGMKKRKNKKKEEDMKQIYWANTMTGPNLNTLNMLQGLFRS